MTWAEYRIRLFAYERIQKRLDYRQRDIMYQTYVSNWMSDKKKPVSINKFWKLDDVDDVARERRIAKLRAAQEKYLQEKNART